ncbi:MAG: Methylthioribose-1-phosphate isomerase [Syntrophus sp. PtaU1.Bin208]|nr:MAG: Methylthioribose-1-phosphate isomerase [Syntrophus sp. PtaU1.Bin208]
MMPARISTLAWQENAVHLLDQKALPTRERTLVCTRYEEVLAAIKDLTVRGAPAIGVAAAMGIALGALALPADSPEGFQKGFDALCDQFAAARPTARNLFWAIERMKGCFSETFRPAEAAESVAGNAEKVRQALIAEARRMAEEDVAINRRIGQEGQVLIGDGACILTHCNAGALATAGYGTALGVIRAAREAGKQIKVFADETRPVLQGARLTAWELQQENIPVTLITDNMAGFLMKQGRIDCIIVGADRIAANGDTANKIGTYSLAVLASVHRIPFYVAAPLSTIDLQLSHGDEIPIEERPDEEVLAIQGVRIAPAGVDVYNPAFDVTPGRYISAIITEAGIARFPYESSLEKLLPEKS